MFLNLGDKALSPESREFIVAVTLLIALSVVSLIMLKVYFNAKKSSFKKHKSVEKE